MDEQFLNLEFLWLLSREASLYLNQVLKAKPNDSSLKLSGPLLQLKKDLSTFCGFPIFIKDCKKKVEYTKSNNERNEKKSKNEYSLFHLEFYFDVFCTTHIEKNPEDDFKRFAKLFSSTNYGIPISNIYLKFTSAPPIIENRLSSENRTMDLNKFSLGNFIELNKFYERFDSKTSLEKDKYKITQVKLLLLHDYKKLILYFLVGKNCPLKKRNSTTHRWFKLELQYPSINSIVISKADNLIIYIRMLLPPLLYSIIQDEDANEDCVSFYEIDYKTNWTRAIDLYENSPTFLKKEFSMNTVLKIDFKSDKYDFIFHLLTFYKSIQLFFAPVIVIKSPSPSVNLQLNFISKFKCSIENQEEFECFYALQCLLTHSFEINDQLVVWQEIDAIKSFLQEKCEQKPNVLCRAFYYIFEVISNGNVINFFECLKYLYELLQNEEAFVVTEGFSNGKISEVSQMLLIKRAIFTPTHLCLLPPQPILKSRALRDCNPYYSLRISIKDINMDSINYSTKSYSSNSMELQKKFFNKYYKNILLNGLHIGKRNYKYVGSSSSQLKSHGLWFYAKDSKNKTADDLRKQFGSFEKICNVPKYMARMGQTFSQSLGYIEIPQEWTNVKSPDPDIEGGIKIYLTFSNSKSDVKKLLKGEDVEMQDAMPDPCKPQSENFEPYTFSDGVGRISKELAEEIYKKFDVEDQKPSAMQIRYAGCKGMLVMDPRLEGKTIKFRKSMKKFDSDHTSLEILKFSEKRACFLNRPLITILEQLGISKEIFLKLQKEMVQKHISSMFHEWDAYHFLNRHALLRIDFLRVYTAEIHFTEDPLFRSMIYALFQKQLDLLKNKANIEIPVNKGRSMFGVMDDTFTLVYGQVFIQYSEWKSDKPIIFKGIVVVTKNPCLHPGDVRKFQAVDVKELHHIVDCIVFPAKGSRPHPDEMAGSDLDGDEYQILWMEELIFPTENFPPMHYASKDKPKELNRPITISDEIDHICDYIYNDNVGQIANAHLALADQLKDGIFNPICIRLAKLTSIALDFAKSGKRASFNYKDRAFRYPDFMQKLNEKKSYLSRNALGFIFRSCKRLELGLETEKREIDYKLDDSLVHEKWEEKYKLSASRVYEKYCKKIQFYMNAYGFENEGQLLAGALIHPPNLYENRHDMSNLMNLVEFEVQWIFRNLERNFFEEFDGKPKDDKFTDEMFQKASAWYMVTYSKNEKHGMHFFGLPWAVSDVLAELKLKNRSTNPDSKIPSMSLLEETIDKSVSKHFKMLSSDASCEAIHENRTLVLDVAYKILTRWIKSQKEYFSDPDLKKLHKCISKEFEFLTSDLIAGDVCYIAKLKRDDNIRRAISPSYNVIETILHVANLGVDNSSIHRTDVQQELGLLAWVTLVKLACTYNPQYLGVPNLKGEYATTVFYRNQDNVIETLQLPLFEKDNKESTRFSIKITRDVDGVKQYLKEQAKLKDIDFRIIYNKNGDDFARITARGTRYSIERLKDIVVMDEFFDAVVFNQPL